MDGRLLTVELVRDIVDDMLNEMPELRAFRIGVAGSVARGKTNKRSDVDLVFDTDLLDIPVLNKIKKTFPCRVDIIQLPLLKSDSDDIKNMMPEEELLTYSSIYDNVVKDVVWFA